MPELLAMVLVQMLPPAEADRFVRHYGYMTIAMCLIWIAFGAYLFWEMANFA